MILGNMQSYYRRNSIHNQSPSHGSHSKTPKDQVKRFKHLHQKETEDEEEPNICDKYRRRSFSISRNTDYDQTMESCNRTNVPIIKIGMYDAEQSSKKSFNILKEKERVLWMNNCSEADDNAERLGPNRNNIIEESLQSDKTVNEN